MYKETVTTAQLPILKSVGGPLFKVLGVPTAIVGVYEGVKHRVCPTISECLQELTRHNLITEDQVSDDYVEALSKLGVCKDNEALRARCIQVTVEPGSRFGFRRSDEELARYVPFGEITYDGAVIEGGRKLASFDELFNLCWQLSNLPEGTIKVNDALTILQQGINAGLLLDSQKVVEAMGQVPFDVPLSKESRLVVALWLTPNLIILVP